MIRIALFACLLFSGYAHAQELPPDQEGCKDSTLLSRMPRCRINDCSRKEFDSADVLTAVKNDEWVNKTLEGETDILKYECVTSLSTLQIARNMEAALRKAGYSIVYNGKNYGGDPTLTARKGDQWIQVVAWMNGDTPSYDQTAVLVKQMTQELTADAAAWAAEIEKSGRVAVYGIQFDTGKAAIKPESEKVLNEIVTLLNNHPDWKLRVEGHTDSAGNKAANQALSHQRAASVVSWLVSQGIEKGRLTAQGFGDSKPLADNATEEGRAQNRRVELVKQ